MSHTEYPETLPSRDIVTVKRRNNLCSFRFMWPCIVSKLWRERENQQVATIRYLLSTLFQHVSGHLQENIVLLKMGKMMPETCWDSVDNKHLIVESCWFSLSLSLSLFTISAASFVATLSESLSVLKTPSICARFTTDYTHDEHCDMPFNLGVCKTSCCWYTWIRATCYCRRIKKLTCSDDWDGVSGRP